MIHLGHMLLLSGLLSFYFAFLLADKRRRLKYGFSLWGILVAASLGLSLLMYPFS